MYPEVRIIFLDGKNVDMKHKPSAAHAESLANSLHYGRNVAKGGVGLQNVLGVVWTAASDTFYQTGCGVFKDEDRFQSMDTVNNIVRPFLNILDEGYRVTAHALA